MGSHYYLLSFEENLSHEHVISAIYHYIGWCRVTPQRHDDPVSLGESLFRKHARINNLTMRFP